MNRPRTSTLMLAALIAVALLLVAGVWVLGRTGQPTGKTVVTVRLWDQQVAAAYRDSFAEFTRTHPDIDVRVDVVAYASYFDTLRTDVAGGGASDIFWINNAYLAQYADNGRLMAVDPSARRSTRQGRRRRRPAGRRCSRAQCRRRSVVAHPRAHRCG